MKFARFYIFLEKGKRLRLKDSRLVDDLAQPTDPRVKCTGCGHPLRAKVYARGKGVRKYVPTAAACVICGELFQIHHRLEEVS